MQNIDTNRKKENFDVKVVDNNGVGAHQETYDKYENEENPRGQDYKEGYDYGLVLYEEQNEMREWIEYREGSEPKPPQPSNPTGMKIVQKAKDLIHGKGKEEWYD